MFPGDAGPRSPAVERAVVQISRLLLSGTEVDLNGVLQILGQAVEVDRCYLFQFREEGRRMDNAHEWCAPGAEPQIQNLQDRDTSGPAWTMNKLRNNEVLAVENVDLMPPEADYDKGEVSVQGIKAYLLVPIYYAERLTGFLGFDDTKGPRRWTGDDVRLLRTAADLINAYLERRWVEEALELERAELLALFESIEFPIYVADPDSYEILYANSSAQDFPSPLVGKLCYQALQGLDAPCPFCTNSILLKNPQSAYRWEYHNPRTNKDYIIYNKLIRWTDGRKVRFELDVDITELNRSRQAMARAEKLESLGVLAGGIAHDFNNILTGVLGNLSLARERAVDEELAGLLEEAEGATLRARQLTGQLLTFAKGDAPRRREAVDLGRLLRETVTFSLRGSSVAVEFAVAEDLSPAQANESQIAQVIQNLTLNAVQAMPGGGTITVEARNLGAGEQDSAVPPGGRYVEVAILDTGEGISPELLDKIFDPFFTTKKQGSGLGLSTAHAIVAQHGGELRVSSKTESPQRGTAAVFMLPASTGRRSSRKAEAASPVGRPGGGRVLIMDDESTVREVTSQILGRLGYDTAQVSNGEQVLEIYQRERERERPFDVVILDMTVPGGMGGLATIERLYEADPQVKAIVATGYSSDPIMEEYRKHHFSGCIAKPFSMPELAREVRRVLEDTAE